MERRYIFIGDIHGCYDELLDLLAALNPQLSDVVLSLGDFVDRGPYPEKCIELWIERGFLSVVGNHDMRLIEWSMGKKVPFAEGFASTSRLFLKHPGLIGYLATLPYFIYFDEINAVAVHAALDINQQNQSGTDISIEKSIMLRGRYVRPIDGVFRYIGLGKENEGDLLWVNYWRSELKVFYGHTPTKDGRPLVFSNTIGIDTGCAYGAALTAAISYVDGRQEFHSVPARKEYSQRAMKEEIVVI